MIISLQYLAGFVDGEGWIGVYRAIPNGLQQKSARYTLEVGIGQTLKGQELFDYLEETYGGYVSFYQPKTKNAKAQCKYVVTGDNALRLLEKIEPYLILKKEQANICIRFQREKSGLNKKFNNFRGKLVPPHITKKRESYYQALKLLNFKGNEITSHNSTRR